MHGLMIDIETLGTNPGCVILSIGAVEFHSEGITSEFHAHIDPRSACNAGLTIEPDTVMWWLGQTQEAQKKLVEADTVSLHDALEAFVDTFEWKDLRVWANGASFDFPILKAAFDAVGRSIPWAYYNETDYRTLKNIVGKSVFDTLRVSPTTAHDALADARAQALTTLNIINWLDGDRRDAKRLAA